MSVANLSNKDLKQLIKDTRKFKKSLALRESSLDTSNEKTWKENHQLFWMAWSELNHRYNEGLI